jgi:hypothetical protein
MLVRLGKLPDDDPRKPVVRDWMKLADNTLATFDEFEGFDPDLAKRFIVDLAAALDEAVTLARKRRSN